MHLMQITLPMPPSDRAKWQSKQDAMAAIRPIIKHRLEHDRLTRGVEYAVKAVFYGKWRNKDGSLRKMDVHNRHQQLFDVIAEILGVDDSQFSPVTLDRRHDPDNPRVVVTISPTFRGGSPLP